MERVVTCARVPACVGRRLEDLRVAHELLERHHQQQQQVGGGAAQPAAAVPPAPPVAAAAAGGGGGGLESAEGKLKVSSAGEATCDLQRESLNLTVCVPSRPPASSLVRPSSGVAFVSPLLSPMFVRIFISRSPLPPVKTVFLPTYPARYLVFFLPVCLSFLPFLPPNSLGGSPRLSPRCTV